MKPPLHYYGGKIRLARWIASLMPRHKTYVEPFFGSGAVLFAKPPSAIEVVSDIDGNLVAFFRVLRDRPADLMRVCRLTPYARDEFDACRDLDVADELERARRTWVRIVQAYSGATGSDHVNSWSASARNNACDARVAQGFVDRMEPCSRRLASVIIDNKPAVEVIAKYGTAEALIYADPPYLASARRPGDHRLQCQDYAHDYSTEAQHRELAATLAATPAAVLLSGYRCPLYDELYADWWRVEVNLPAPSSNRAGRSGRRVVEVVWSNRPLASQGELLFDATAEA